MKKKYYDNLTEVEMAVYKYLKNVDNHNSGMREIANQCYTSTATIIRMYEKLGFQNYEEFKAHINQEKDMFNYDHIIDMNKISDYITLSEFNCELDLKDKMIYSFGNGASGCTAQYFARQLQRLGYNCYFINDHELVYNPKVDMVFLFSTSGKGDRVIKIAKELKNYNAISVGFTKAESFLANEVDIKFTHKISIDTMNYLERENQLHMMYMSNLFISKYL